MGDSRNEFNLYRNESDWKFRKVQTSGEYCPEKVAYMGIRHYDGKPGYHVVNPFKTSEGFVHWLD